MGENKEASIPVQPLYLYLSLAPRLPLLLNHSEGSEITAADVYNYLTGSGVPECSHLFFSNLKSRNCKIPLRTWVEFEMKAAWGNVPVEVRQTFLYNHLVENVSVDLQSILPSECQPQTSEKFASYMVFPLVFILIEKGLKQRNSSDLLMLVQTAGQHSGENEFCLLELWHKSLKAGFIDSRRTLSFMSICRCVSPSQFLRAEKLLELAEILQTYIHTLQSASDSIQLSLGDTTFLCASLFTAADKPSVKNLHVELCLKSIKPAVVFHWESMRNFFRSHMSTIIKHDCLRNLYQTFDMEISNQILHLEPEEGGIRLLSIILSQSVFMKNDNVAYSNVRSSYVKWLLAYLGLQQVKGDIPYLLREGEELDVTRLNRNVIQLSYMELKKLFDTKTTAEVIGDIFPAEEETHLGLRLVPVACIFVVMCVKEGNFGNDIVMTVFETNFLDIILQCHNLICHTFDTQSNGDNKSSNINISKKSISSKRWLPNLDYLSHLHQKILSYLSASSPLILANITKSTLVKCDSEVRAAVYSRLASKKKC